MSFLHIRGDSPVPGYPMQTFHDFHLPLDIDTPQRPENLGYVYYKHRYVAVKLVTMMKKIKHL